MRSNKAVVFVTVEGGVASIDAEGPVTVRLRDYDTDGTDENLTPDDDGNSCFESIIEGEPLAQPLPAKFAIGTEYLTRGKSPRRCTVKDIHRTYNAAGDLVKFRYVSAHEFMGQLMIDSDVCETTVSIGVSLLAEAVALATR